MTEGEEETLATFIGCGAMLVGKGKLLGQEEGDRERQQLPPNDRASLLARSLALCAQLLAVGESGPNL